MGASASQHTQGVLHMSTLSQGRCLDMTNKHIKGLLTEEEKKGGWSLAAGDLISTASMY